MQIIDTAVLVGPNLHGPRPVINLVIDAGPLDGWTVARLDPSALDRLRAMLPALAPDATLPERPLPEFMAPLTMALQAAAGTQESFCTGQPLGPRGRYLISLGYETARVGLQAGKIALALIRWSLRADEPEPIAALRLTIDPTALIEGFVRDARAWNLDQTTAALVSEAARRGIPWFRPLDRFGLVQFGHGAKQARILETVTDRSSVLAGTFARSKARTNRALGLVHLPTTQQMVAGSEHDAIRAAEKLGYPVVVKPDDRGKGLGVTVGLRDAASVVRAFRKAQKASRTVLVEALVPGDDHRMLVVKGSLVAVAKRLPARVIGDGRRSIAELVDEINRDPRRGIGFAKVLVRLELDGEADRLLAEVGLTRLSIPGSGQVVLLRGTANISTGGSAIDMTRQTHVDNRLAAERAARVLGLDIAGVDFITPDISRSWREVGGAICEVNQSPSLRPHWASEGSPETTGRVMDAIVPRGGDARIPIAAITGTSGKTTTTLLLGHILGLNGRVVGTATGDGVGIGHERVAEGDFAGVDGCRILFYDPLVETAVIGLAPRDLIRHGLFFDWCDVAAVLNVDAGPVDVGGVTIDNTAKAGRLLASTARRMVVLNADDPLCVAMAPGLEAERLCYVSLDPASPLIAAHVAAGRPALWLDGPEAGATILVHDGQGTQALMPLGAIPIARLGLARDNIEYALVAAALALGLGASFDEIRRGLGSFSGAYA